MTNANAPRLASRDELLAALRGRDRLTPIEVTDDNLAQLQMAFAPHVHPGCIVWSIPDSKLYGVAYCHLGDPPPIRVVISTLGPPRTQHHIGDAMIVGDDSPYLREDVSGMLVRLITGMP
jgi:hypothetical protein